MSGPTGLPGVRAALGAHGWRVLRAWPRDPEHLLLHLAPDDRPDDPRDDRPDDIPGAGWVAGQWFADDTRAAEVADACRPGTAGPARHLPGTGVVLQPGGADARLRLAAPLAQPGATLVAHRPGRRAVVRHLAHDGDGTVFTKVVRPSRTAALAASASWRPLGVDVPEVLAVDPRAGTVTTAALPGRTLHDLPPGRADRPAAGWVEAGALVAALHAAQPPAGVARHDVADELAVTLRWVGHALEHRAVTAAAASDLRARARASAALLDRAPAPGEPGSLHRDLHDRQVLVGPAGAGVLDLDLVAVGDPALDVANLLVHVLLREEQAALTGRTGPDRADARAAAFLAGYGSTAATDARRLRGWAGLAAVRVAAVYALRAPLVPDPTGAGADVPAVPDVPDVGGPALGPRLLARVEAGLPGLC